MGQFSVTVLAVTGSILSGNQQLDRLLTYSAAQVVAIDGGDRAAALFRHIADQIEAGAFAHLEGKPGALN